MLKLRDVPEIEFLFKELNKTVNIIETSEIAFITYEDRWSCFWISIYTMNSETGTISEEPYSFYLNTNAQLNNKLSTAFNKFFNFLNDSSIFDIFNPKVNKDHYAVNLYNITTYYFVKDMSVKIKNKISLNVSCPYNNSITAPPIFYAFINIGLGGFAIPFNLSFDFKYIFDHFENKEITADASRYRFKIEKAAKVYDKKIRSLEEKINEVKREKDEVLSKINLDEIDKRLFEIFDEGKISSVRLYEILKNKN